MIQVTRLDGSEFYINAEFIITVESTPDTHIVMVNGPSYVVTEPDEEVVSRILDYRRGAYGSAGAYGRLKAAEG
jgi:flagellar protein FlbD